MPYSLTRRRLGGQLCATSVLGLASQFPIRSARSAEDPIIFGVFPYLPALQIGRWFGPVASCFSALCSRPVSLQTKPTFPGFRHLLLQGHYDIALVHPYFYAEAVAEQDYQPLGRLREDLRAVVIAPKERRLSGFVDLRGETLATPPPLSAVAQLVEQDLARQRLDGPDGVQLATLRTKTACLHAVASGTAKACAFPPFALAQLEAFEPIAMEPKFSTPSIPGIVLAAHARLGEQMLQRLRSDVLGWHGEPNGQSILKSLGWTGFVAVEPGEYAMSRLRPKVDI